jgi:23S rRNA (pseudouridine1915-N3)-methyltransferase
MHIHLLAVGTRMPGWVQTGFYDYARRLPPEWRFVLKEIPAPKRGRSRIDHCVAVEGERLLTALPTDSRVTALDIRGKVWSTEELAAHIGEWQVSGQHAALLIGGSDGLAPACIARADALWCLSRLTLPHALVRIIVAEQLYRASTILRHHPYHRG